MTSIRSTRTKQRLAKLADYDLGENDENGNKDIKCKRAKPKEVKKKKKDISLKRKIQIAKPLAVKNQNIQLLKLKETFAEKKKSAYLMDLNLEKEKVTNCLVTVATVPSNEPPMEIESTEPLVTDKPVQNDEVEELLRGKISSEIEMVTRVHEIQQIEESEEAEVEAKTSASNSYSENDFFHIEYPHSHKIYKVSHQYKESAYNAQTFKTVMKDLAIGFLIPEKVIANDITKKDLKNVEKSAKLVLCRTKGKNVPVLWIVKNRENMKLVNRGCSTSNTLDPAARPAEATGPGATAGSSIVANQAVLYKTRVDEFRETLEKKGVMKLTAGFKHFINKAEKRNQRS